MIYLCKCGRLKHGSPWKSAATKPWLCPSCASFISNTSDVYQLLVLLLSKLPRMAEQVDARDLKSLGVVHAGSTPVTGTILEGEPKQ